MKLFFCFLAVIALLSHCISAHKRHAAYEKVYDMSALEKLPSFPGGEAEMLKYIHPKEPRSFAIHKDSLIGTKVLISFVVDTLGKLSDFQILKDVGGGYGSDLVRIFKSMPAWVPGEFDGRPVKTRFYFPITVDFH
jgi:protein TonB